MPVTSGNTQLAVKIIQSCKKIITSTDRFVGGGGNRPLWDFAGHGPKVPLDPPV